MNFEIFNSSYSKEIKQKIQNLSEITIPIFIFGEFGTGKSYIANQILGKYEKIYKTSFTLMENSNFFDYFLLPLSKNERCGFYITDIEKSSKTTQIKFLKKLQNYQVTSHFIFSSNESEENTMKILNENFYYFLSPINISTVCLSQRKEDIIPFIKVFSEKITNSLNIKPICFSPNVINILQNYSYKKNISELKSTITNLVLQSQNQKIEMSNLPSKFLLSQNLKKENLEIQTGVSLKLYEQAIIETNFFTYGKNKAKTAEILGMSTRNLYRKLKEYNI